MSKLKKIKTEKISSDVCKCGKTIEVMAFKGTGFCSVNCKKEFGHDVSSVGTMMFVTTEERELIGEHRGE